MTGVAGMSLRPHRTVCL